MYDQIPNLNNELPALPVTGDKAPEFTIQSAQGTIRFPEMCKGQWCIFFAHPANFTSAWRMYSTLMALKERWVTERNTKLIALSTEPIRQFDWSDKVRRYIGIFLHAQVIEDTDLEVANLYGMASGRRKLAGNDRLAFFIDPEGVIRLILHRPLKSIELAMLDLEKQLDILQGNLAREAAMERSEENNSLTLETPDFDAEIFKKPKPAYFTKKDYNFN